MYCSIVDVTHQCIVHDANCTVSLCQRVLKSSLLRNTYIHLKEFDSIVNFSLAVQRGEREHNSISFNRITLNYMCIFPNRVHVYVQS